MFICVTLPQFESKVESCDKKSIPHYYIENPFKCGNHFLWLNSRVY